MWLFMKILFKNAAKPKQMITQPRGTVAGCISEPMVSHSEPIALSLIMGLGVITVGDRPKMNHRAAVEHHVFLVLAGTRVNLIQVQLQGLVVDLMWV